MNKIIDLTGKEHSFDGCMACAINEGKLNFIGSDIFKGKYFSVLQDAELPIDGFVVIASNRHVEKLTELNSEEQKSLIELINKCLTALQKFGNCEEYNVVLEEKAGYHFHVWLMPRANWMIEKFGKVLKNIKPIQDYAKENMKTTENLAKISETCKKLKLELNKQN